MIRLTAARNAAWMTSPDMNGHRWAKEQLEKTIEMLKKYTKTPAQKKLAKIAFKDSDDWHYWCNIIGNKYINMVQYALRRVGKGKDLAVLVNIDGKHPMYKTAFLRYLEYLAATKDYKNWLAVEVRARSFMMSAEDAVARVNRYRDLLIEEFGS